MLSETQLQNAKILAEHLKVNIIEKATVKGMLYFVTDTNKQTEYDRFQRSGEYESFTEYLKWECETLEKWWEDHKTDWLIYLEENGFFVYTLPAHWGSALINADYSGCNEEDTKEINDFLEEVKPGYCVGMSEESWFSHSNDAHTLACDVAEFTFHKKH
ncbi:MAG: hypothetical protein EHM20_10875 [Alphaproteobacteria bacterium]|nr:MAG: hypothetical protein EHM20_10875 [Alphaproteobacteria bacterium]